MAERSDAEEGSLCRGADVGGAEDLELVDRKNVLMYVFSQVSTLIISSFRVYHLGLQSHLVCIIIWGSTKYSSKRAALDGQ